MQCTTVCGQKQTFVRKFLDFNAATALRWNHKHMFDYRRSARTSSLFPYRRKSRANLVPLIQLFSLVLVFALPVVWASRIYTSSPAHYDRVVVHSGDSVWSLVARQSAPDQDVNEATYQVMALNHLRSGEALRPGQVLLIPR